jgi:hypothetical protein
MEKGKKSISDNSKKLNYPRKLSIRKIPSSISSEFLTQEKKFSFRNTDLLHYRQRAREILEKEDLEKRFKKAVASGNVKVRAITKEKKAEREKPYGDKSQVKIRIEGKKVFGVIVDSNNNTIFKQRYDIKKNERENFKVLQENYKKAGFDYKKEYIPEDTEPKKKGDARKRYTISYDTYCRVGILIYRMKDGRKYELIYQTPYVIGKDKKPIISKNITSYVSYQWIIAQVKEDILEKTGLTLEEWLYLAKTDKTIFVEKGMIYKRFKYIYDEKAGKIVSEKLDYEQRLNFG